MRSAVRFSRAAKLEFSFVLAGWGAETGETSSPLRSLLATFDAAAGMGTSNRVRFSDAGVDALLSTALTTIDDTKRGFMLAAAAEKAIGDLQGLVPLHYEVSTWAMRKGISYRARADQYTFAFEVSPAK
jgi:peptide/nickel transport system substrate-binding protein